MSLTGKKRSNPTAAANRSARRRARELAGASVRSLTLDELYERDKATCYLCHKFVPRDWATKEHIKPLSKGGRDTPGNSKLAHRKCNSEKGAKTPAELRKEKKRPGLKRKAFKRKVKPLDERAKAARERREFDQSEPSSLLPYVDQVDKEEVF